MFRLAVFTVKLQEVDISKLCVDGCTCFPASTKPLVELWLRCTSADAMASVLERILLVSSILAFGTLSGRIVLPSPKLSIEDLALEDSMLPNHIEVKFLEPRAFRNLIELSLIEASINVKTKQGFLSFKTAPKASQLFDIGMRVLKPVEIPPKPETVLVILKKTSKN